MKKYILIMMFGIFCFTAIAGYAEEGKIKGYIGLKSGTFALEKNSLNIFSLGGTGGCIIPIGNKYVEAGFEEDFNIGCFGGDYVSGFPGDRAHIRTLGVYGVVRTIPINEVYMKCKIGFTSETKIERIENMEKLYKETGPSFGIGAGYNASNHINVEGELTTTNSNMKFFSIVIAFVL